MSPRSFAWLLGVLASAALAVGGALWLARADLQRHREAFDTDARIAHRLLSQRTAQHDAIVATLALLQPGDVDGPQAAPERRLPALYPQVIDVFRRDRGGRWSAPALDDAEAQSRGLHRPVVAQVNGAAGHYTLVQAAEPASFALRIDLGRLMPTLDSPMRLALAWQGQALNMGVGTEPGTEPGINNGAFGFEVHKVLSTDSQPFELVARRRIGWGDLPWGAMAAWLLAVAAGSALAATAARAWQRQRQARRRAEALLQMGQVARLNALGELAAGMAHELNQPLAALLANTQAARRLLADDPSDLDTARHAMDQAAQQARRAGDVLARLRAVVQRPQRHQSPAGAADAMAVVRRVLDLLRPECERRGVQPQLSTAPNLPHLPVDAVALEQIVHNLVMNALQALDQVPLDQRRLDVVLAPVADGGLRIAIRDSGPGIAPAALPRLFEPFFTTRSDGLGLGLSLCDTLATALGGHLTAGLHASRGAEFVLQLPAAPSP